MSSKDKLKVLVIDDELTQRMLVKEYLEDAGHTVRQAEDGKRGLKMAQTTKPDVVLLDLLLPSMDGYALCKALKVDSTTADVPVILVTAAREPDVIEKGLAVGADDFLTKPIDWAFLSDRIANVVKRARERAEMTRRLNAPAAPAAAPVVENRAVHEAAEAALEEMKAAHSAEITRLAAEHAAAVDAALDRAQMTFASEIEREKTRHDEALRAAVLAERARLEQLMSDEGKRLARQMRQEYQETLDTNLSTHREQLDVLDAQRLADIEAVQAAARRECAALERRHRSEIEALKSEMAPSTGTADPARAAWSLAARWAAAQQSVAGDIAARVRQTDAQLEQTAKALQSSFAKFRTLADAMLNREQPEQHDIALAPFLAELGREAAPLAASRRVHLDIAAPRADVATLADSKRLRYCVLSLIVNAVRFTPAGGTVTLAAGVDKDGVRIEVADKGVGMAPAELAEISNCLDAPAANSSAKTVGLGLPTVMALARQMRGKVEIESGLGAGTSVSILLPMANANTSTFDIELMSAG